MKSNRFWAFAAGAAVVVACSRGGGGESRPSQVGGAAPAGAPSTAAAPDATRPNAVMDAALWDDPQVKAAYVAAKKYAHVLEQLYCYCRCKENIGHRALVECFETDHASMCDVCMTEAMTAARMTEDGKTPKEIQQAIDAYYRT